MSGYGYGDTPPTEKCPYCNTTCHADFVDIGVGFQQCGPFNCQRCGASEIGPNDEPRPLTPKETETNWYAPHTEPGSSANIIGGEHVSHQEMKETYQNEFSANPLWHDKTYVDGWWNDVRKP